jgi:hypothetical protein
MGIFFPEGIPMQAARAVIVVVALMCSLSSLAAETIEIPGPPALRYLLAPHVERILATSDIEIDIVPVGTAQAMLDLLDRKVSVAGVVMTLPEAVAEARAAALSAGRKLRIPDTLVFHEVGRVERGTKPVGFVTLGAPSGELQKVLAYFRSESARALFAGR